MTVMQSDLDRLGTVEAAAQAHIPHTYDRAQARSWPSTLRGIVGLALGAFFLVYLARLALAPKLRAFAHAPGSLGRLDSPAPLRGPRLQA